MFEKRTTILMISPMSGNDGGGGIAVYADMLTEKLKDDYIIKQIATMKHQNIFDKIYRLLVGLLQIMQVSIFNKSVIAHVNTAHDRSFFRKAVFIKLLKLLKIPIVLHLHSSEFHNFFNDSSVKKQIFIKNIFKSTDKVIVLSNSWKKWYINTIEKREPIVIYNGMYDLNNSNDTISDREDIILFMGRLGKRKGTYDLLESFSIILKKKPNVKLILAGDGEIKECQQLATSLGIVKNVDFLGWIGNDRKQELLNTSKVFTLPSYNEGFPLSILEAMSSRLPIVSSNAGGIEEEIEDGISGFLINAGDINKLAFYILNILENKELCDEVGNKARARYLNNFTIDKIIKDTRIVYEEIINPYYYNKTLEN